MHEEGPWLDWAYEPLEERGPEPDPDQWQSVRAWKPSKRNLWRWGY